MSKLEVVRIYPRNIERTVCDLKGHVVLIRPIEVYTVFRATLPDRTAFAVDIGGQQFGWKEVIAPWERWYKWRAVKTVDQIEIQPPQHVVPRAIGSPDPMVLWDQVFARGSSDVVDGDPRKERRRLTRKVSGWLVECLDLAIRHIYQNGWRHIYEARGDAFMECEQQVVNHIKDLLTRHVVAFEKRPDYRLYITPDCKLEVAIGKELCETLEKVWLSGHEYASFANDLDVLKSIWDERWARELGADYITGKWKTAQDSEEVR